MDREVNDIFYEFEERGIISLRLKQLGVMVPELSIREISEGFILDEITSLDLCFYNSIHPYKHLKWFCLRMKNLRNINLGWHKPSLEKMLSQLANHRFYQIKLQSYEMEIFSVSKIVLLSQYQQNSLVYYSV